MVADGSKLSYAQTLSVLEEIYKKCERYEKVVRDSRREMVSRFNVAASEVMTSLEEGRRTNKIKKKMSVSQGTVNPIIAALEKSTKSLELSQDRKEWQVVFYNLIAEIKFHEEECYSTPPFLYQIFEKSYADLSKRSFLPIVWNHYPVKWMMENVHYRKNEFFSKNKRSAYREEVFKQLLTIFDSQVNKVSSKERLNDLLIRVKVNDHVLGDFLESIITNWTTKGILADAIEDIIDSTYSELVEQCKVLEARKIQLEDEYNNLKNKMRMRLERNKEIIKRYQSALSPYPKVQKDIDQFLNITEFAFINRVIDDNRDAAKLKAAVGCYYVTIMGRIIAASQLIQKEQVDDTVKESAGKISCVLEATYSELVEEGVFPTKFEYYRLKLREDVIKIFAKYQESSCIKINKAQQGTYQQLLVAIGDSKEVKDLAHALKLAQLTSQSNHEVYSSMVNLKLPFRKKSRLYHALQSVEKKHGDWLSSKKDPIIFAVEREVEKYFSGNYFYHSRARRQQANDLIHELYEVVHKHSGDEEKIRMEQWRVIRNYIGIIKDDHERRGVLSKVLRISTQSRLAKALETVHRKEVGIPKTLAAIEFYDKHLPIIQTQLATVSTEYRNIYPKLELRTDSIDDCKNDMFSQIELLQAALLTCKNKKEAQFQFNLIIGRLKEMLKDGPSLKEAFQVVAGYETPLLTLDRLIKNAYQNLVDLQLFEAVPANKKDAEDLSYLAREAAFASEEASRLKAEQQKYNAMFGVPKNSTSPSTPVVG